MDNSFRCVCDAFILWRLCVTKELERFPQKTRKTLPVESIGVGMTRTILEAWTKLEFACGAIDVELYLPLANVDVRPCGLEERPPKYERRLAPFSHIENHKVNGD